MPAITSALATGTALVGTGMNIGQAVKANRDRKEAQTSAASAAQALTDMKQQNAFSTLQVPTLGFNLAQQGLDKATQAALQTTQGAGAEGVIGGVGNIVQAANAQELALAADANKAEFDRNVLESTAQQDINASKFKQLSDLELSRLTGAQLSAYKAQENQQNAISGSVGALGTAATAALNPENGIIPAYLKKKSKTKPKATWNDVTSTWDYNK